MTNKAHGQTFSGATDFDMKFKCFTLGQLNVAVSRIMQPSNIYLIAAHDKDKISNVVYKSVLSMNEKGIHNIDFCRKELLAGRPLSMCFTLAKIKFTFFYSLYIRHTYLKSYSLVRV